MASSGIDASPLLTPLALVLGLAALAWFAFPRTKAAINRLHMQTFGTAAAGKHGRGAFRDLLTLLDEGGAIVSCSPGIAAAIRGQS